VPFRKVEDLYRVFTKANPKTKALPPAMFVKIMSEFGVSDTDLLERLYHIFDKV